MAHHRVTEVAKKRFFPLSGLSAVREKQLHLSVLCVCGEELLEDANMKKKVIHTEKAPKAIGPYSQAIQAGDFLFLSGQLPLEPASGEMAKGDIRQQTKRVLENIKGVLESQNLGLEDVVKVTVFLKDMGNFSQMNEVYATYFPTSPPARSTVEISGLARDAGVEIEAIALV